MTDKLLGYQALVEKYQLTVIPHLRSSFLLSSGIQRVEATGDNVRTYYPASYWPGERDADQLAFALKYEGLNRSTIWRSWPASFRSCRRMR